MNSETIASLAQRLNASKPASGEMFDFGLTPICGIRVLCESSQVIKGGIWEDCRIELGAGSDVALTGAKLRRVEFVRSTVSENRTLADSTGAAHPRLSLQSGEMTKGGFAGSFSMISIHGMRIRELYEFAEVETFKVSASVIRDSKFVGRVTTCEIEHSEFDGGTWMPEIHKTARVYQVRFDGTRIDIATLLNSCDDRNSIDVHKARILDKWAEMRNSYTGSRLVFVLLLTFVFILPYLAKTGYLVLLSKIEHSVPFVNPAETSLWRALLVGHRSGLNAILYGLLGITLLYYNLVRFVLTMICAKMREQEQQLQMYGFSRVRPSENGTFFNSLWSLHRLQGVLFYLVIATALWRTYEALTIRLFIY